MSRLKCPPLKSHSILKKHNVPGSCSLWGMKLDLSSSIAFQSEGTITFASENISRHNTKHVQSWKLNTISHQEKTWKFYCWMHDAFLFFLFKSCFAGSACRDTKHRYTQTVAFIACCTFEKSVMN